MVAEIERRSGLPASRLYDVSPEKMNGLRLAAEDLSAARSDEIDELVRDLAPV